MTTAKCSGCYNSFSGWWCDNCDQWPCVCMQKTREELAAMTPDELLDYCMNNDLSYLADDGKPIQGDTSNVPRERKCELCDDSRWIDDRSACTDPEHCSPIIPCPACNPAGEAEQGMI